MPIRKIVLVKPPERSFFNFGTYSLGVLGAAVRHLAEVVIIDATDRPLNAAVEEAWEYKPEFIGVTVMGLASVKAGADFLRGLKTAGRTTDSRCSTTSIIAGGHGASMSPALLLEAGADAVVMGEGELTLPRILTEGIRPGSPGLACLTDAGMVLGPPQKLVSPLDRVAPPARELMPQPPDGVHLMETSRGCPHACAFCETTRFYGRRWRAHSPERVAVEVKRLVEEHNAWIINIADDNFTADPQRVLRICEVLQRQMLPAFFMVSARGDDLLADSDLLPAMAAARILRVTVGVESLYLPAASGVGKPIGIETYHQAFKRMRELGIFSVASLIVGLPGENPPARASSVELAIAAEPDSAHFLPFLPLPGTPLAAKDGGVDPDPADLRDAKKFTQAFFAHPAVQARLQAAAQRDDIRGILARGTLEKHSHYTLASDQLKNLRGDHIEQGGQ